MNKDRKILTGKNWSIGISSYRSELSDIEIRIDDTFTPDECDDLAQELRRWAKQQREARLAYEEGTHET